MKGNPQYSLGSLPKGRRILGTLKFLIGYPFYDVKKKFVVGRFQEHSPFSPWEVAGVNAKINGWYVPGLVSSPWMAETPIGT
jgi:hypothetical protein